MTTLRVFLSRLAALVRARRFDDRLNEEIEAHLELAAADSIARGMTPEEARLDAVRQFGGVTQARETYREVGGFATLDALWQDVRDAIRSYRKSPGFTLAALLTLTLAIGANTAIFSLLNALVLRDLPVRDPGTLVQIATSTRTAKESFLTFPMFRSMTRDQRVFSSMMATWRGNVVHVDTGTERTSGLISAATDNLYAELGVRPAAGRLLAPGDMTVDPPSAASVVVLGHAYWRSRFHGDPSAIGRTIRIEDASFTIIGVAPPGFTALALTVEPDLTIPLTATPLLLGRAPGSLAASVSPSVRPVGRLKPGVTLEQARAQLMTLWPAVREAAVPADYSGAQREDFLARRLSVESGAKGTEMGLRDRYTRPLVLVMSIAGVILVIACVNLASLLLSRASARSHEIAVRLALGASRWRIARQMITEGVLLSVAGACCGALAAYWMCRAISAMIFEEYTVTVSFDPTPDGRVIVVTAAASIVAGVLFSVVPALRGTRQSSTDALKKQTRAASASGHTGRLLVSAQVALSLVLLANAGLLVRSLAALRAIPSGIQRTDRVMVAYPGEARAGAFARVDNDSYYPQVLERIEAIPGVRRASVSLLKPGTGGAFSALVAPLDEDAILARGMESALTPVAPGFFDTLGIHVLQGRDFTWTDSSRSRHVTILSESLARRLFGRRDAIGQRVRMGLQADREGLEVIGIADDARVYDVKNPNLFAAYTPALQNPSVNYKCFVISGAAVSYDALKGAVEAFGHETMGQMVTLQYISDRALLQEWLTAMLSGFFGALALLLSAIGLYGLMAYTVAQRRREIGIRVALGAAPRRVMREVVRDGLAVTLTGVAAGFAAALATVQLVRSLLFGVTPHDPLTLVAAPASLVAVAMVACLLPAARAARVDPMIALRTE
jgi:predicted permease